MNILHISRRFIPCIGGTEKFIYEISSNLLNKGFKCRVLTANQDVLSKGKKFPTQESISGIDVVRLPVLGNYKKIFPLAIPFKEFEWADIVHLHDLRFLYETALILKSVYKYKIVLSSHGFLFHTKDFKFAKEVLWKSYYRKTISTFIDAVICSSSQDFSILNGVNNSNMKVIEDGISFEKLQGNKRMPQEGRFLYFGRIDKNKGIDVMFNAFADIRNMKWQLDIVGFCENSISNYLKSYARELGISNKIEWHGLVDEYRLQEFILKSHICFFPSTAEGFGFTLVEALANGCICIANDIAPYREKIDNGINGFIVDFYNPSAVIKAIHEIINLSIVETAQISLNAKEKARKYSWKNKIDNVVEIYNSMLKS